MGDGTTAGGPSGDLEPRVRKLPENCRQANSGPDDHSIRQRTTPACMMTHHGSMLQSLRGEEQHDGAESSGEELHPVARLFR